MRADSLLQACASVAFAAAWKIALLAAVLGLILFAFQQHRQAQLRAFCEGLEGDSARADVERGARESGLELTAKGNEDIVATRGPAWGLSWCYVRYKENGGVESTRFAHE